MACTYDAADNTLSSQCGGSTYNYAYDNANHLVQVQANGAVMADYTYNLNNERLSKTVGGNTDRYVYNEQSQLLGETGSAHRDYLWLDDLPIGVVDNGSTVNYLIADALNMPRVITDNSGATAWYWPIENNAFGEQQPIGSFTYNLRFPGQYYDAESGFFYNVHRYYDPATGRYVQSDPLGLLAGVNTYGYTGSNPVNRVDPLGLWSFTFEAYAVFGGGITIGQDPVSGKWFYGGRLGVGFSVGGSVDPRGARPGADGKDCDHGTTVGVFEQGGFTAGLVGGNFVQADAGLYLDNSGRGYFDPPAPSDHFVLNRYGFGLGYSVGIEVIGH